MRCSVTLTVLDHTLALPNHGDHSAGGQEVYQVGEEGLPLMLGIVKLGQVCGGHNHLQRAWWYGRQWVLAMPCSNKRQMRGAHAGPVNMYAVPKMGLQH